MANNDANRNNEIRKAMHFPLHKQGLMPSITNPQYKIRGYARGGFVGSRGRNIGMGTRVGRPFNGRMRRSSMSRKFPGRRYNTGGFVNSGRRPVGRSFRGRGRAGRNFASTSRMSRARRY